MTHTMLFQYNVPAENQFTGRTDFYLNAIATWNEKDFYYDGRPMVNVQPINLSFHECISVKDWYLAYKDIETIAIEKFTEIAQQKKIDDARQVLALHENPILNRQEKAEPAY